MLKVVFCLNRKDGMSHKEFGKYWYGEHADIAREMPNLERYTLAFPADPEGATYDGMAQLYFDDQAALDEALDSRAGEEAAADLQNFADPDSILQLVVNERTLHDRT